MPRLSHVLLYELLLFLIQLAFTFFFFFRYSIVHVCSLVMIGVARDMGQGGGNRAEFAVVGCTVEDVSLVGAAVRAQSTIL